MTHQCRSNANMMFLYCLTDFPQNFGPNTTTFVILGAGTCHPYRIVLAEQITKLHTSQHDIPKPSIPVLLAYTCKLYSIMSITWFHTILYHYYLLVES